ncbi:toxin-antitoxin system YwqK family antitoxin [Mucilaginibacter kameinonensis]|uniref:toxin-antitoxin system YwqK family antitoxin n=1 Tax=Mucilaginibacter kameinonensis TaxID=452286 RepID=UPI000EF7E04B|nr:hypothetical protein [Mucilaginibacter kameinonensis]
MSLIVSYEDVEQKGTDAGGDIIYYYQNEPLTGIIKDYKDGVLVGEAEFTDGHRGGIQREYNYPSGILVEEYFIKFNKLEGSFKNWDDNGILVSHTVWQNGKCVQTVL